MKSVIVYGKQGCGKTKNAKKIAEALGLKTILDEWIPLDAAPAEDHLMLTSCSPGHFVHVDVMTYDEAMSRVPDA